MVVPVLPALPVLPLLQSQKNVECMAIGVPVVPDLPVSPLLQPQKNIECMLDAYKAIPMLYFPVMGTACCLTDDGHSSADCASLTCSITPAGLNTGYF